MTKIERCPQKCCNSKSRRKKCKTRPSRCLKGISVFQYKFGGKIFEKFWSSIRLETANQETKFPSENNVLTLGQGPNPPHRVLRGLLRILSAPDRDAPSRVANITEAGETSFWWVMVARKYAIAIFVGIVFLFSTQILRFQLGTATHFFSDRDSVEYEVVRSSAQVASKEQDLSKCEKYIMATIGDDASRGIGHRFVSLVGAFHASNLYNASPAVDPSLWSMNPPAHQNRSSFDFLPDLLNVSGLILQEASIARTEVISTKSFANFMEQVQTRCNAIFLTDFGAGDYCGTWCVCRIPNMYSSVTSHFSSLFRSSRSFEVEIPELAAARLAGKITVTWHVRNGDITLLGSEFFSNLFTSLEAISEAAKCSLEHFVVSDLDPSNVFDSSLFDGKLKFLYQKRNLYSDLMFLIKSDITIGTGSSLAYMAALLKSEKDLFLSATPKEVKLIHDCNLSVSSYQISDYVDVESNGAMRDDDAKRVEEWMRLSRS